MALHNKKQDAARKKKAIQRVATKKKKGKAKTRRRK